MSIEEFSEDVFFAGCENQVGFVVGDWEILDGDLVLLADYFRVL